MKYFLSGCFLAHASLWGWGNYNPAEAQEVAAPAFSTFPYDADQGWFVDSSYLLWIPFMENMQYGTRTAADVNFFQVSSFPFPITLNTKAKVKQPDFGWDSGVRVGIGRYLPNHDLWDINFYTTYFYGQADDKSSPNVEHNEGISPDFLPMGNSFPMGKGSNHWQLNYFTYDLMVGRNFLVTPWINFHAYFGIRATTQYQKFKSRFSSFFTVNQTSATPPIVNIEQTFQHRGDNDYWGIGPRIGTHFAYYFADQWSFLGNLAASIVMGQQRLQQRADFFQAILTPGFEILNTIESDRFKSRDKLNAIRANLEGYLGLGWETWFRDHTVRLAPSLLFEGAIWFAMNQLWYTWPNSGTGLTGADFDNRATRKHGNLGLMGLTFDLQVDF